MKFNIIVVIAKTTKKHVKIFVVIVNIIIEDELVFRGIEFVIITM
jgi:hypothetical protein